MSGESKSAKLPLWLTALLVAILALLGTQSLFLFKVWRNLPNDERASAFRTTAPAKGAERQPFQAHKNGTNDPFDDMDPLWRDFDKDDWDPFDEFRHMREQMNSLFDDSFGRFSLTPGAKHGSHAHTFAPNLDLQEKDDCYVARMDIPGADKNNVSVNLEDRDLTVSGRISESTEKKDGDQVLRKERRSGSFKRSLTLPGPVAADKLDARYDNGVLTITIPKAKEDKQSKTVQVK